MRTLLLVTYLWAIQSGDGASLLDEARAALGEKIRTLRSLTAVGTLEKKLAGRSVKIDFEISFLLPDRFMKREKMKAYGRGPVTVVSVLDGESAWMDMEPRPPPDAVMGERSAFSEGPELLGARRAKSDFGRLALLLLLRAPTSLNVEATRRSEIEVGGRQAVIVELAGDEGFEASLYLDRASKQLIKLDYVGPAPPDPNRDPSSGPTSVIFREQPSDYRVVSGILLPHRITRIADQRVFEELKFKMFVVDPPLDPALFKRKAGEE